MKTIINNNVIAEIANQQTEDQLVAELDAAKTFTDLRKLAGKYPDVFKDIKGYRSFDSLFEAMQDYLEPGILPKEIPPSESNTPAKGTRAPKAKKAPKPPKVKEESAYGTAIKLMCKNPSMDYKELVAKCKKVGFDKPSAIRTGHVCVRTIYRMLQENGFAK